MHQFIEIEVMEDDVLQPGSLKPFTQLAVCTAKTHAHTNMLIKGKTYEKCNLPCFSIQYHRVPASVGIQFIQKSLAKEPSRLPEMAVSGLYSAVNCN